MRSSTGPDSKLPSFTVADKEGNNARIVVINPLNVIAVEEVPEQPGRVNIVLNGGIVYHAILETVDEVNEQLGDWLERYRT
ncbi:MULTISPECIES: hypothetical protein [unclassified Agrobacterium]|uniref:hypothetical protein n=1 Tax=unclassified Agrobacterium TaxID=2632611 RepID=UPI00244AD762|nr:MULTISPECIES: hypothetical protein [unclassified Agrobacterium]MDH0613320.1 hypothetical protein [Agrobacterium sp. GD03872]MDH0697237.1 hypothetical protein [Agrobacterium sp. GD03871]MDH1062170.1 hypothetical protein [Agrobacterium sp. GD03992]MDH2211344.1 hypothetical protein [Agrobacterium sp. GD03643]MDH2220603.1 hypothetical protein [Agrobacterium sp. GD03638]